MFLRLEALKRGRTLLANLVASLPNGISLGKTFVKPHKCLGALPLALSSRFSTGYSGFYIPLGKDITSAKCPSIASFPGSCVGGVKSLVRTVCACSVTPGFLGLWKLADTTPQYHSVYHRIIVRCTRTIEDGGAFRRVWERG